MKTCLYCYMHVSAFSSEKKQTKLSRISVDLAALSILQYVVVIQ